MFFLFPLLSLREYLLLHLWENDRVYRSGKQLKIRTFEGWFCLFRNCQFYYPGFRKFYSLKPLRFSCYVVHHLNPDKHLSHLKNVRLIPEILTIDVFVRPNLNFLLINEITSNLLKLIRCKLKLLPRFQCMGVLVIIFLPDEKRINLL